MAKVIIFNNPDTGMASVIVPVRNTDSEEQLAKVMPRLPEVDGSPVPYWFIDKPVDEQGQPVERDRTFRDAWECDVEQPTSNGSLIVNMSKARGIHMNKIRAVRDKELAKLDVPFLKAVEIGDTSEQQRIAEQKNTLRDIPQTLDLTTNSTDELKQLWPEGLPKE